MNQNFANYSFNIDRIFVLSLKTSIKRQTIFKENFPELIKLNIFEWFLVDKDSENTERGCYTSHQKILKLAKERNYETILVIEDDVKPLVSWNKLVSSLNSLKRPKNWKMIQLGYIPIKTTRTTDPNLFAVNCSYFAEAYMLNVKLMDIPDYSGDQIDCFLFCRGHSHLDLMLSPDLTDEITKDVYAYNPRLFQQSFTDSDIGHDNGIIVFFYNFYGFFYDTTELSSYINLLLLSFFIVFSLFLISLIVVVFKFNQFFTKIFAFVLILLIFSTSIIIYLDSDKIITEC